MRTMRKFHKALLAGGVSLAVSTAAEAQWRRCWSVVVGVRAVQLVCRADRKVDRRLGVEVG
jgi:hypothetical protein